MILIIKKSSFCLLICLLSMYSCSVIELNEKYESIGRKYSFEIDSESRQCYIYKYTGQDEKKISGNFKFKEFYGRVVYAQFLDGKYNGEFRRYEKGKLIDFVNYKQGLKNGKANQYFKEYDYVEKKDRNRTTISYYENGLLDGVKEEYLEDKLYQKTNYKQGIKNGYEYNYNTQGDTLSVVHYSYQPHFQKPTINYEYLTESDKHYLKEENSFKFMGKISVNSVDKNELYALDLWGIIYFDFECEEKQYCIVEYENDYYLVFYQFVIYHAIKINLIEN